jgi:hypothetical protein
MTKQHMQKATARTRTSENHQHTTARVKITVVVVGKIGMVKIPMCLNVNMYVETRPTYMNNSWSNIVNKYGQQSSKTWLHIVKNMVTQH